MHNFSFGCIGAEVLELIVSFNVHERTLAWFPIDVLSYLISVSGLTVAISSHHFPFSSERSSQIRRRLPPSGMQL